MGKDPLPADQPVVVNMPVLIEHQGHYQADKKNQQVQFCVFFDFPVHKSLSFWAGINFMLSIFINFLASFYNRKKKSCLFVAGFIL